MRKQKYSTRWTIGFVSSPSQRACRNLTASRFLPDGSMLVAEIDGRLRVIRDGVLQPEPISGVPEVKTGDGGGLMDVVVHPRFSRKQL